MQHRRPTVARPLVQGRPQRHATRRQPSSRGGRSAAPTRRSASRSASRSARTNRTLFHAPSFSAGVVMGAVVVLGAAYLPELLSLRDGSAPSAPVAPAEARPALTFEFDDLLRNSKITADPEPYLSEPAPTGAEVREEILLQAASFRSRDDAERLRAALLLMDLPASTSATRLDNGGWYRVTVGPFDSRVQAQRALTRLREKDIAAIWMKRPKS